MRVSSILKSPKIQSYNNFNQQKLNQNQNNGNMSVSFMRNNGAYYKATIIEGKKFLSIGDFEVMKKVLTEFVETECKPFLAQTKEFSDKNHLIHDEAKKMTSLYYNKLVYGHKNFNIFGLNQHKGYEKVNTYLKNIEEYNYLKQKNQGEFGCDAASQHAQEIAPLFEPASFMERYRSVNLALKKIEKDIKNGFAGLNEKQKTSQISQKINNVYNAKTLSSFNQSFINADIELFVRNVAEALENPNSRESVTQISKYNENISAIRGAMETHRELFPELNQRTDEAEKLLGENKFSEEDIDKAIHSANLKKQGIIKRNLKAFNESLENQPKYKWNDNLNAKADELLQKQSDANKKLWELIEQSKKEYYSPEAVAKRNADIEAEHQEWLKTNNYSQDDLNDLPF